MKNQNAKEAFVLVYNKDFSQINEMRLTDMDAFVYVTMKLMAGNPHAFARLYATPDAICSYDYSCKVRCHSKNFNIPICLTTLIIMYGQWEPPKTG